MHFQDELAYTYAEEYQGSNFNQESIFDLAVRVRMDAWGEGVASGIISDPPVNRLDGQGHYVYSDYYFDERHSASASGSWTVLRSGDLYSNLDPVLTYSARDQNGALARRFLSMTLWAFAPDALQGSSSTTFSDGTTEQSAFTRNWDFLLDNPPLILPLTPAYNIQAGQKVFNFDDYGPDTHTLTASWQFNRVEFPPGVQVNIHHVDDEVDPSDPTISPSILRTNGWGANPQQRQAALIKVTEAMPGSFLRICVIPKPGSGGHEAAHHTAPRPHGWLRTLQQGIMNSAGTLTFPPYFGHPDYQTGSTQNNTYQDTQIRLQADEQGTAKVYYVAPEIGGTETIQVYLENPAVDQQATAEAVIEVKVRDLLSMEGPFMVGPTKQHLKNWFASDGMRQALWNAQNEYQRLQNNDDQLNSWVASLASMGYWRRLPLDPRYAAGIFPLDWLLVNDISLENGGLFDLKHEADNLSHWIASIGIIQIGHKGHYQGKHVDIRTTHFTWQAPYEVEYVVENGSKWSVNATPADFGAMRGDDRLPIAKAPFTNKDFYLGDNNVRIYYNNTIRAEMQTLVKRIQERRLDYLIQALRSPSNFETFVPEGDHIHVQYTDIE